MASTVGLIGLGAMGSAVAGNLMRAGYSVVGYDPDPGRRQALSAAGGRPLGSIGAVAASAALLLSMLPTAAALEDVCDDLLASADSSPAREITLAEMSTLALSTKLEARTRLAGGGIAMLDCALSGTAVQAVKGDVVVYASGEPALLDRWRPVLLACGRAVHDLGQFGAATQTKLVANHLVAIHIAAAAEALLLAQRSGLDLRATLVALGDGAGSSRMLQVRGPMMADGSYDVPSTKMEIFLKDLHLIEEFAIDVEAPAELFSIAARYFRTAASEGRAGLDTAAVFAWLDEASALEELPNGWSRRPLRFASQVGDPEVS